MIKKLLFPLSLMVVVGMFILAPQIVNSQSDPADDGQPDTNAKIVGGTLADDNEYPWQVALQVDNSFCGGSLIATDWVLTAAHCVEGVSASRISAFVGVNSLSSIVNSNLFEVSQVISHPNYDSFSFNNDIALLRLSTPITVSCSVNTIGYATSSDSATFAAGNLATVTGWGATSEGGSVTSGLREVDVPIVSNSVCNSVYGNSITGNMICAGFSGGGKDSCQGDSGGPLVVQNGSVSLQAGIVSFGRGCARPDSYGVYTRVEQYTDWIDSWLATSRNVPQISTDLTVYFDTELVYLPFIENGLGPGAICN
ncbi:MAG: serine protease [Chloroflexota bacterium]